MKKIYLCVTTNLSYDQRMQRICTSLSAAGYDITLVGRSTPGSPALEPRPYQQVRIPMWFSRGKKMYAEYNLRLFFFLLQQKMDGIVSIDLDTIIPCYYVSRIKGIERIHDAHEWFSEMKEVVTRPRIQRIWKWIEKKYIPRFKYGYTVSASINQAFKERYAVDWELIMNTPPLNAENPGIWDDGGKDDNILLYQGAVNEGRCFEWLIPAMKQVDATLWICGEGNFSRQCRVLVSKHGVEDKVLMMGNIDPAQLALITPRARVGINLVEQTGLSQYYSLANKFFDYIHASVPQVTMLFPEYQRINSRYPVALLLETCSPELIAAALNNLLRNKVLYATLKQNCSLAAQEFNWQREEQKLTGLYSRIFG